jgi:hypothetical protein
MAYFIQGKIMYMLMSRGKGIWGTASEEGLPDRE